MISTRTAPVVARRAGFLRDIVSLGSRALRSIPRDPESVIPALIVPVFFGNPVYIFLIRQFILSMPGEMLDAGRIDGCSNYRLYLSLTLPLLGAPIATVAIFQFMFSWNDFLYPLVFINSDAMKTLALGLMDLMSQSQFTGVFDWGLSMSATALALIPCFIVYLIAQRYFIQGVNITQVYTGR